MLIHFTIFHHPEELSLFSYHIKNIYLLINSVLIKKFDYFFLNTLLRITRTQYLSNQQNIAFTLKLLGATMLGC